MTKPLPCDHSRCTVCDDPAADWTLVPDGMTAVSDRLCLGCGEWAPRVIYRLFRPDFLSTQPVAIRSFAC